MRRKEAVVWNGMMQLVSLSWNAASHLETSDLYLRRDIGQSGLIRSGIYIVTESTPYFAFPNPWFLPWNNHIWDAPLCTYQWQGSQEGWLPQGCHKMSYVKLHCQNTSSYDRIGLYGSNSIHQWWWTHGTSAPESSANAWNNGHAQ